MATFESNFIGLVAAIFGLGIMILVHEWGHFVAARLCGVRVEVFSFGLGPRLWGVKRGATDYRVSALPFGGYVRMAGDNPSEERTGAPDEFLSKPRWQRVLIALAGPTMNILMAVVLWAGLFSVGVPEAAFMTQPAIVAGVVDGSPAAQAGIRPGDQIVSINGAKTARWEDAVFELAVAAPGKPIALQIDRGGQRLSFSVDTAAQRGPRDEFAILGFPKERVVIGAVTPGSPAEKSGLKSGDEVVTANSKPILNSIELATLIRSSDGKPVQLSTIRDGQPLSVEVHPQYGDPGDGIARWQIGIGFRAATVHQPHSFPDAAYRGVMYNVRLAHQIFDILGGLFEGRVSLKQLEGPVGIVRESGQAARRGFMDFISLMGVISLNLGILNLLPIPILDGGHILMLGIEGTIRRDLSLAVKERFVQAGLVFLLAIIAYVTYHDIFRILWNR